MNLTISELCIFDVATEDYEPLLNLVRRLRAQFPRASQSELVAIAKETAKKMLSSGWISIHYGPGWGDEAINENPLDLQQAEAVLEDDKNWDVPSDSHAPFYAAAATEEGHRIYQSQPPGAFDAINRVPGDS